MEYLSWAFWSILAILGAVFVNMLASELYDRCGDLAETIVSIAANWLPRKKRLRYHEEWLANLQDGKGKLSRLLESLTYLLVAYRWASSIRRRKIQSYLLGAGSGPTSLLTGTIGAYLFRIMDPTGYGATREICYGCFAMSLLFLSGFLLANFLSWSESEA